MSTPADAPYKQKQRDFDERAAQPVAYYPSNVLIEHHDKQWIIFNRAFRRQSKLEIKAEFAQSTKGLTRADIKKMKEDRG